MGPLWYRYHFGWLLLLAGGLLLGCSPAPSTSGAVEDPTTSLIVPHNRMVTVMNEQRLWNRDRSFSRLGDGSMTWRECQMERGGRLHIVGQDEAGLLVRYDSPNGDGGPTIFGEAWKVWGSDCPSRVETLLSRDEWTSLKTLADQRQHDMQQFETRLRQLRAQEGK